MGGRGSGRGFHRGGKATTEGSRPLDIRKLHRAGLLIPGRTFGWQWLINGKPISDIELRVETGRVILSYKYRGHRDTNWEDVKQSVSLSKTSCNFGGTRPWWLCPTCGRRVAVLYSPGKLYACRHCSSLAYSCQRETADDRAMRRADNIRRRLGWPIGIANPKGAKPKKMHWATYERLNARHDEFAWRSLTSMAKRLGLRKERLGKI